MSKLIIIIALFVSEYSLGQVAKGRSYLNIKELRPAKKVSLQNITGTYYYSDGFDSFSYRLDSNFKFKMTYFSDGGISKVDSGLWTIKRKNILVLRLSVKKELFNIVLYGDYYFLIPQLEKDKFIKELGETRAKYKEAGTIEIDKETNGMDFLTSHELSRRFYSKMIYKQTGT